MKSEIKEQSKLDIAHEIQQLFRYNYTYRWADQSFINQHSRQWIQVFNELVKERFIEKKKAPQGYNYRWSAKLPDA